MGSANHRVGAQVDHWLTRLIDLSRRNRLLYFRESRCATLRLVDPSPGEVFDTLTDGDRMLKFWVPEPERLDTYDAYSDESEFVLGKTAIRQLGLACSGVPPRDAVETADPKPKELARTLRRLAAKAPLDLEERGIRILHVALGMSDWEGPESRERAWSPVILVQAELVRESRNDLWELAPCDEDTVLNPALAVKLQRDLGVTLPDVPDTW